MDISWSSLLLLLPAFFLVAALYASVGHGGASGYLAILSFLSLPPALMSSTALVLNVFVSGASFLAFSRRGHFSGRLAWPFLATSIPAALLSSTVTLHPNVYFLLLAGVLVYAAGRLAFAVRRSDTDERFTPPTLWIALPTGAGIGALSGLLGVGGGIFLSPVILLMRWGDPRTTATVSSLFILLNSLAGLAGRLAAGTFRVDNFWPFLVAAFFGGLLGARLGARHFSTLTLRRILAAVLVLAAVKLFLVVL